MTLVDLLLEHLKNARLVFEKQMPDVANELWFIALVDAINKAEVESKAAKLALDRSDKKD